MLPVSNRTDEYALLLELTINASCGKVGHIARNCTESSTGGSGSFGGYSGGGGGGGGGGYGRGGGDRTYVQPFRWGSRK